MHSEELNSNLIEEKWMQIGVKDKYIHDYGVEIIIFLKRRRCEEQHIIRSVFSHFSFI
jgi:hypothetical protein